MNGPTLIAPSRTCSSNLSFALMALPKARRRDAFLFYRFCKSIDDIADDVSLSLDEKSSQLGDWRAAISSGHLPEGLCEMLSRYGVDSLLLLEILSGCESDLTRRQFRNLPDLEKYCWQVAAVVGLVSLKIFGCKDPRSDDFAIHLGHALQLVNILRDVAVDARLGRIYLPLSEMERFGVTESGILLGRPEMGYPALAGRIAGIARMRFAACRPPAGDFQALLPARIMMKVYEKILDRMEMARFAFPAKPVKLSIFDKMSAVVAAVAEKPPRS